MSSSPVFLAIPAFLFLIVVLAIGIAIVVGIGVMIRNGKLSFGKIFGIGLGLLVTLSVLSLLCAVIATSTNVSRRQTMTPTPLLEYERNDSTNSFGSLRRELSQARGEVLQEINEVQAEVRREIANAQAEVRVEISQTEAEARATAAEGYLEALAHGERTRVQAEVHRQQADVQMLHTKKIIFVIAGGLFVLAGAVIFSVFIAARNGRLQWGKVFLAGFAMLWLVPIVLVVGYFMVGAVTAVQVEVVPGRMTASQTRESARPSVSVTLVQPDGTEALPQTQAVPAKKPAADDSSATESPVQVEAPESTSQTVSQLPDWVGDKEIVSGNNRLVVLTSKQFATPAEGDSEIVLLATEIIKARLHSTYSYPGEPIISQRLLESHAFGRRHVEEIERHSGANTFRVYRVYRQLELSPQALNRFEAPWRESLAEHRLGILGAMIGMLTLIVTVAACYFRLDTRTEGAYRRRLRFAAACLVIAGSIVAMSVVSRYSEGAGSMKPPAQSAPVASENYQRV